MKGYCLYHQKDFDKLSDEQKHKLVEHHDKAVRIWKDNCKICKEMDLVNLPIVSNFYLEQSTTHKYRADPRHS